MSRIAKASLLLFFFSLCGAAFIFTSRARERAPVPGPHELFAVVNQQLTALRAEDFSRAYRHAASGVQQKFTLPQFESMVRQNYGEMTRAHRVEFGTVQVQGSAALLHVFFTAADGSVRSFLYSLISEGDSWKINGVEEISVHPQSASLAGLHV